MCDSVDDNESDNGRIEAELAVTIKYLKMLDDDTKPMNPILITCEHENVISQLRRSKKCSDSVPRITETDCLIMYSPGNFLNQRKNGFSPRESKALQAPVSSRKLTKSPNLLVYGNKEQISAPMTHKCDLRECSLKMRESDDEERKIDRSAVTNAVMTDWKSVQIIKKTLKVKSGTNDAVERVENSRKFKSTLITDL
ncbi:hypothetical protein ACOME3_002876 [Neoechinorhynchus agilis]